LARPDRGVIWIGWPGFRGTISNFLIWKVRAVFSFPGVDILATGAHKAQLILLKNRELLERVKGVELIRYGGAFSAYIGAAIHGTIQEKRCCLFAQ